MNEGQFGLTEGGVEHIPTEEKVNKLLRQLIGKEYSLSDKREDAEGLYLYEVIVPGEVEGRYAVYAYWRKGDHPGVQTTETEIKIIYFENGIPVSGDDAARYIDGGWEIYVDGEWRKASD